MNITIAEKRISEFLNNIVSQFQYEFKKKADGAYYFENNGVCCTMLYEKRKKLFSKVCNFIIKIETTTPRESFTKTEVFYDFRKLHWYGKGNEEFSKVCNDLFQNNYWGLLDFEKIRIQRIQNKLIFEMMLLPGSFTSLVFPPLSQGIPIYESEIVILENIIKEVSNQLILLTNANERRQEYV